MTTVEQLRARLRALGIGRWGDTCPDGTPVPERHRCAAHDCDSVPLTTLRPGATATVTCLDRPGSAAAAKLTSMGVLPGATVVLVRRYPVYLFRLGYSELAVDEELARHIRVRTGDG